MKLSVQQQQTIIPDSEVHEAFLLRKDIIPLPIPEQEQRWQEHKIALDHFREFLSTCEDSLTVLPAPSTLS